MTSRWFILAILILLAAQTASAQSGPDEPGKAKKKKEKTASEQKDKNKQEATESDKSTEASKDTSAVTEAQTRTKKTVATGGAPADSSKAPHKSTGSSTPPPRSPVPTVTQPATSAPLSPRIARAVFTTAIVDREPSDSVDSLSTAVEHVYFFTELVDMHGQTVTHRWLHQDTVRAEVSIHVRGIRWRAYSKKKILPAWTGQWSVQITDSLGTVLGEKRMSFGR